MGSSKARVSWPGGPWPASGPLRGRHDQAPHHPVTHHARLGQRIHAYMYACVSINTRIRYTAYVFGRIRGYTPYAAYVCVITHSKSALLSKTDFPSPAQRTTLYAVRVYTRIRAYGAGVRAYTRVREIQRIGNIGKMPVAHATIAHIHDEKERIPTQNAPSGK
jgi:hypothetical protein